MTTPNNNLAIVDAQGLQRQMPAFVTPSGALAAAYTQIDPVSGHAANIIHGAGDNYAALVAMGATLYGPSSVNSTTTNQAAGASFVGQWEALPNQGYVSINAYSDQPLRVTVRQAQDAGGARQLPPLAFFVPAGGGFNQLVPVNGNFVCVEATNLGSVTSSTFVVDAQYMSGGIPTTDRGAVAVGITEPIGMQREGNNDILYTGRNSATPGTAVALNAAAQTTFAATAGAILVRNTNAAGGPDIHLRKLQLITVAVGTGLTSLEGLVVVDKANRFSSGGTVMAMASTRSKRAPAAEVRLGPVTLTAAGSTDNQVKRLKLRQGIPVVGDVFKVAFGSEPTTEFGALAGTAAQIFGHSAPPVIIPPGGCAAIYLWAPGQTAAPTFEVELILAER